MGTDHIHRTRSDDGTEIAGRVKGQGPPIVLVHGSLEDGDLLWDALLPFLQERFTCYLMSTRGRGSSGESDDLSPERLVQDVTSFANSVGSPVGLVGESAGGMLALGAAARSDAVAAVAVYEPVVLEALGDELSAELDENFARVAEVAGEGALAEAARMFAAPLVNDDERKAIEASDYFDETARYVPLLLRELELAQGSDEPGPTDASVLRRIEAPVLALNGSRSALRPWFRRGVRHVTENVPRATAREIDGTGHWAPVLAPEPLAREITAFFDDELPPHLT